MAQIVQKTPHLFEQASKLTRSVLPTSLLLDHRFSAFFLKYLFVLYACWCFPCVHAYAQYLCMVHGVQKRVPNSLKLELQVFVNCYVGPGYWTCVLCKSIQCSQLLSHFSSSSPIHLTGLYSLSDLIAWEKHTTFSTRTDRLPCMKVKMHRSMQIKMLTSDIGDLTLTGGKNGRALSPYLCSS